MMKQAVGYLRVSTSQQADTGDSLDAQRSRIQAWAQAHGYELAGLHADEGISGAKVGTRPGVQAAIGQACELGAVLVVYSLSRLSRSTKDAIELLDTLRASGADLVSLSEGFDTTSPAGKALFRMIAVFAEFERDVISERISEVMSYRKAQGLKNGGHVPFGYGLADDGETLTPDPAEQAAIELMQTLRVDGYTLQAIADELKARGIRTRTGKAAWQPKTISRILQAA